MTLSVTIKLAIAIQPTLQNRSTPDTVNGKAIFKRKMYPVASFQFFLVCLYGGSPDISIIKFRFQQLRVNG